MEGDKVSDWIQNLYNQEWSKVRGKWNLNWEGFVEKLDARFLDLSRHADARQKFDVIRQGQHERAVTFFERFEILVATAQYELTDIHVLQKIERAVRFSLIDDIYRNPNLPTTFKEWKDRIINLDEMQVRRDEAKKAWTAYSSGKSQTSSAVTKNTGPVGSSGDKKDSTGTLFGGAGKPMDFDKARKERLCFNCGGTGHMARDCPKKDRKFQVRQLWQGMSEADRAELFKDFSAPQQ